MEYKNYIFDLYGTLIDIHTDETKPGVWKRMAGLYARLGADYEPEAMMAKYRALCADEFRYYQGALGVANPEVEIGRVFERLFIEAPNRRDAELTWGEETTDLVAAMFRTLVMRRFRLYENTIATLDRLKKEGANLYLLSNAQHRYTQAELEETGLLPYFKAYYISSDVNIKKPEASYMKLLLDEQHLNPKSCVMIGNEMESDMRVAAACGVDGVYLNTSHFKKKELKAQLEHLQADYPEYEPVVIKSGDIAELK